MIDPETLKRHATLTAPGSLDRIAELGRALRFGMPNDYFELLEISNGLLLRREHSDGFTTEIRIYPAEEVLEANATFEIPSKTPAHILIGDNGGYYGVLLNRTLPRLPVHVEDLNLSYIHENPPVSSSLREWINSGFPLGPLDDPRGRVLPERFDILMVGMPKEGTSGLLKITAPWPGNLDRAVAPRFKKPSVPSPSKYAQIRDCRRGALCN